MFLDRGRSGANDFNVYILCDAYSGIPLSFGDETLGLDPWYYRC